MKKLFLRRIHPTGKNLKSILKCKTSYKIIFRVNIKGTLTRVGGMTPRTQPNCDVVDSSVMHKRSSGEAQAKGRSEIV